MKPLLQRRLRLPLLARIVLAIVLGIVLGRLLNEGCLRAFITFNRLFSELLNFLVPLIIVGFVTPAIADIGRTAGRLLVVTLLLSFGDTLLSGLLGYGTGVSLFPSLLEKTSALVSTNAAPVLKPYFELEVPPLLDVMSALVISFITGLGIAYKDSRVLKGAFKEFESIISSTITNVVIPLLPLYICGIFMNMTYSGEAYHILFVFGHIIVVIFILHLLIMLYEYVLAGMLTGRNPLQMLYQMLPAYFTALGTSSSAATIPVTLRQTVRNKVSEGIAGFVIPLCATIHISGSMMKITCCALTICMMDGMPYGPAQFMPFILALTIYMVAAPGVPGGAIMASLAPLSSFLGFSDDQQAVMIALYIAMDSFGTACNVTGDGAIAVIVDRLFRRDRQAANL